MFAKLFIVGLLFTATVLCGANGYYNIMAAVSDQCSDVIEMTSCFQETGKVYPHNSDLKEIILQCYKMSRHFKAQLVQKFHVINTNSFII